MGVSGGARRLCTAHNQCANLPVVFLDLAARSRCVARISRSLTAAMCLAVLLDVPLPARRRPSVDTILLAKVLAELGKIGSNINQIAYHLNAGRPGEVMEGSIDAAMAELLEWRTALMQALGYERGGKRQD